MWSNRGVYNGLTNERATPTYPAVQVAPAHALKTVTHRAFEALCFSVVAGGPVVAGCSSFFDLELPTQTENPRQRASRFKLRGLGGGWWWWWGVCVFVFVRVITVAHVTCHTMTGFVPYVPGLSLPPCHNCRRSRRRKEHLIRFPEFRFYGPVLCFLFFFFFFFCLCCI